MGSVSVSQILVTPLLRIPTSGGDVMHGMKQCDSGFSGFGEVYFSIIEEGAIKAWKRHLRMTLNLVVPVGSVQFIFLDDNRETFRYVAGGNSYARLTVPPGIWVGFKGLAKPYSLIMNVANMTHDSAEIERKQLADMKIDWDFKS